MSSEISDFTHVRMRRVIFYVSNTLRKLMIRAWGLGKCVRLGLEKRNIIEV